VVVIPHEWEYRIIAKPYNKGKAIQKYHTCGLELDLEWMCLVCGLTIRQTLSGPIPTAISQATFDKAMEDAEWESCGDE